ncbi:response regulator transcription factor [Pandoraea iniqua]|nr:response regulator transcription factor [Pandoraea iniqua]
METILLLDDHAMVREGLAFVVRERYPDARVLLSSNAVEALSLLACLSKIDLLITDFYLPDMGGTQLIRRMRAERPEMAVMVLSASDDPGDPQAALAAGAGAFVHKSFNLSILMQCISRLAAGERGLLYTNESGILPDSQTEAGDPNGVSKLTPRQLEVLILIGQGLRNGEIALRLSMTEKTVKAHVSAILRTLAVPNRTCAAMMARRAGLLGRHSAGWGPR